MILSKGNLSIASAAKKDNGTVVLRPDGSTYATCRGGFVAVGPVPPEVAATTIVDDSGPVDAAVSPDAALEALKHIRTDKLFGGRLEYADAAEGEREVVFATRDESRKADTTRAMKTTRGVRLGEQALRMALNAEGVRVGLSRKRLLEVLLALDKAAPDTSGEAPLWMVVGDAGVCLRTANIKTDQRVLGWVSADRNVEEARWLKDGVWERGVRGKRRVLPGARARTQATPEPPETSPAL